MKLYKDKVNSINELYQRFEKAINKQDNFDSIYREAIFRFKITLIVVVLSSVFCALYYYETTELFPLGITNQITLIQ